MGKIMGIMGNMGKNKFESLKGDYIESEYNTIYEFIIAITKK